MDALNYGTSPIFSNITNLLTERPDLKTLLFDIIDNSLLGDLKAAMFGKEETYLYSDLDEPKSSITYISAFAETIRSYDSHLFFGPIWRYCRESQARVPYSYIIKELCELVELAKDNVDINFESRAVTKFRADREVFWEAAFGNSPEDITDHILETIQPGYAFDSNLMLPSLDGMEEFHRFLRGQEKESAPSAEGEGVYHGTIIQRLDKHLRAVPLSAKHTLREEFLQYVGVYDLVNGVNPLLVGPLDELRAPSLQAGYFRIALTTKPAEHLMFDESSGRPTVKLLDFPTIFQLYIPQRVGLARYVNQHRC